MFLFHSLGYDMIIDEGCCDEELLVRRPSSGCRGCICCLYDGYEQRISITSDRCVSPSSLQSLSLFLKPNAPFCNDFFVVSDLTIYNGAGFNIVKKRIDFKKGIAYSHTDITDIY
jgi:hypothetical protein